MEGSSSGAGRREVLHKDATIDAAPLQAEPITALTVDVTVDAVFIKRVKVLFSLAFGGGCDRFRLRNAGNLSLNPANSSVR